MGIFEIISAILSVVSVISIVGNIIQYVKKKEYNKDLRSHVQSQYNNFYFIARCITRCRKNENEDIAKKLDCYKDEVNIIRGICDSARISLIAFGREEINFEPYFEHPAYPGQKEYSDDIKMGLPVDERK